MPDHDHLGRPVGSRSAQRSQPVPEPIVIGLDRVTGVVLDVMPGGWNEYLKHADDSDDLQPPQSLSHHSALLSRGEAR